MAFGQQGMVLLIIGCEIAFWVVLALGLIARYPLRWPRVGALLLLCVPLIDLILLGASVIDLRSGATASFAHGLAAAYLGFTVAFGRLTMTWADGWFAHRFAGGPAPAKAPSRGWPGLRYELKLWGRCILAVGVVYVLLIAAIVFVDDPERTKALQIWLRLPLGTVVFWFIFGPLWTLLFLLPSRK